MSRPGSYFDIHAILAEETVRDAREAPGPRVSPLQCHRGVSDGGTRLQVIPVKFTAGATRLGLLINGKEGGGGEVDVRALVALLNACGALSLLADGPLACAAAAWHLHGHPAVAVQDTCAQGAGQRAQPQLLSLIHI